MRQFIDVTGKTEDEAIQNALRELGLDRDDVSVEILERAKSGLAMARRKKRSLRRSPPPPRIPGRIGRRSAGETRSL